jgi:murein DD-endopeptidase MepM/ murein hydrolase activator NlpD
MKRICWVFAMALYAMVQTAYAQVSMPLKKLWITSGFGNRKHPITAEYSFHYGVDLRARNDTVFAAITGRVSAVGYNSKFGIYISLQTGRLSAIYGHLSKCMVATGDSITCGAPIAISGATGKVTGEHLHFSIRFNNRYINPLKFLSAAIKKEETINH